jgi:hypothetical protein
MRLVRLISSALFPLVVTAIAYAQSVRWMPSDSGVPNTVQLVFENCAPDGEPQPPAIPGITFTRVAESTSTNIVNFQVNRSVILTYQFRGRISGPLAIPAFSVKTDRGTLRVPPFNAEAPAPPPDSVASARLIPERTSVWAGEVFGLTYELSASRRMNPQISPTFDWNAAPLVAEDWSKPEVTEVGAGGQARVNVVFRTRAVSKTTNTLKLEAANHVLGIQTGTIGFGIISQPRMEQVSVTSDQPNIEVRPLPTPPAGFSGAVGQFRLTSRIVPEKAAVGEPITWTLELSGTGNWPDIAGLPSRDVSNDFQVVQPKAKRAPAEGKLFDVTLAEDVVLVPSKAGSYALGPVAFTYFDPKSGTYKTLTAPRTTVTITAPAAPQFAANPPSPNSEATPPPEAKEPVPPAAPAPPAGIPGDPIPGFEVARAPLDAPTLLIAFVSPAAVLLLFWTFLAIRRAKQTDPIRPRREARYRLAKTVAQLQKTDEAQRATLLLQWQRDAAVLWQLPQAVPGPSAFQATQTTASSSSTVRKDQNSSAERATWATLWTEADRAIYGPNNTLPADWPARAQAALAARRVPGFQPFRLFLPQNLMPFAAMIALLFVAAVEFVRAAELDAMAAYRKADFPAAEKGWRSAIERNPTDWIARHNLALALVQQDHFPEAAAQATAAFVQKPNNPSVRWHFAHAAEKAGAAPATLTNFITPGPLQMLGILISAPDWQRVLIIAVWGCVGAIAWLLFNAYHRRTRAIRWTALVLLVMSMVVVSSAVAGVMSYGAAAHADSVIVARPATLRSIPTEADTTQKTSPLAAGSLARADRRFLGWTRLSFENGQTGWVRQTELVPLWK